MVGVDYWLRKKRLVLFFGGITGERTWVSLIQRRGSDVRTLSTCARCGTRADTGTAGTVLADCRPTVGRASGPPWQSVSWFTLQYDEAYLDFLPGNTYTHLQWAP